MASEVDPDGVANMVWRAACHKALMEYAKKAGARAFAREYMDEAENQDGYGYWENFQTVEEAVQDFQVYLENAD